MAQNEISRLRIEAGSLPVLPTSNWVIIRPIDADGFKKTKLHLPIQGKSQNLFQLYYEMPLQGIVVAVGPGWMTDSGALRIPPVIIGDHVAVDEHQMISDFIFDGVLYYRVQASGIIAAFPQYMESYFDKYELTFSNPKNDGRSN